MPVIHYQLDWEHARVSLAHSAKHQDLMMLMQKRVMPPTILPLSIADVISACFAGGFPKAIAPEDTTPPMIGSDRALRLPSPLCRAPAAVRAVLFSQYYGGWAPFFPNPSSWIIKLIIQYCTVQAQGSKLGFLPRSNPPSNP